MKKPDLFEQHCYFLDSTGFARVEGFWSEGEVFEAKRKVDIWLERFYAKHQYIPTKIPFLDIDPEFFLKVLDHPLILGFGSRYTGEWFRFDHAVGLIQPTIGRSKDGTFTEGQGTNLHGGPWGSQGSNFCVPVGNRMWFGQLNVGIVLSAQSGDEGGLCYIPGSHTMETNHTEGHNVLKNTLGNSFDHPQLVTPKLNVGDLVVFTEALIHGMAPWKSHATTRMNLYYKFSPGYLAWRPYDEVKKYLPYATSDIQRQLLRPPFVAEFSDEPTVGANTFRSPVINSLQLTRKLKKANGR